MITHGNKQISEIVYARKASEGGGAVRLTNIIRGAQVVFGWLAPNVKWLKAATKAAILAAFGQDDGYAVLGATNAYLNALAATDPTKAAALAGFINQHPLDAALYGGLYVQDGLVFQMDRAYECTAAKWTDFIGGVEFNGTNVQIVDDVPTFGGNAYFMAGQAYVWNFRTHTIEIIYTPNSQSGHMVCNGYGSIGAGFYGGGIIMGYGNNSSGSMAPKSTDGQLSVLTYNVERMYRNKTRLSAVGNDYWGTVGNKSYIGSRNGGDLYNGKIYGIRIYNRLLTEAEILANQDIDLKRFNQTP